MAFPPIDQSSRQSSRQPIRRPTARVVPVNRHGEVLLLTLLRGDGTPGLMTAGGGVEPGETTHEAGVRELQEETGIEILQEALAGPFHRGSRPWSDESGVAYVSESQFFAARVDDVEISFAGHRPDEQGFITGHEWIAPADLHGDPRCHDLLPHLAGMAVACVRGEDYVVHRRTARVVPVNGRGEALLMLSHDPATPELTYWCSFGGAVDEGETLPEVALEADPATLHSHDETETILGYRWWAPEALEADAEVNNDRLPAFVRAAVDHLRNRP